MAKIFIFTSMALFWLVHHHFAEFLKVHCSKTVLIWKKSFEIHSGLFCVLPNENFWDWLWKVVRGHLEKSENWWGGTSKKMKIGEGALWQKWKVKRWWGGTKSKVKSQKRGGGTSSKEKRSEGAPRQKSKEKRGEGAPRQVLRWSQTTLPQWEGQEVPLKIERISTYVISSQLILNWVKSTCMLDYHIKSTHISSPSRSLLKWNLDPPCYKF